VKDTAGAIGRAEGGTLFVDEIDKLSPKAQAGLLRVLEERLYRPLGEGAGDRRADVRFIIGTNANLRELARAGRFREDLFYRVNVLPVRVPPLAERRDEIAPWASYMLGRRHREGEGQGEARIAGEAARLLAEAPWPGNLRQLDNIVRRAYAMALVERAGAGGPIVIELRHAERALAYESEAGELPLLEHLRRAARAFVIAAERRAGSGPPLSLDLAEALRGLVLHAAAEKLGSPEQAFLLFGQETLVKGRNHHKVLRREMEKVAELCRVLGEDAETLPGP
jgi:DNA-binding NtrC family response regulator